MNGGPGVTPIMEFWIHQALTEAYERASRPEEVRGCVIRALQNRLIDINRCHNLVEDLTSQIIQRKFSLVKEAHHD